MAAFAGFVCARWVAVSPLVYQSIFPAFTKQGWNQLCCCALRTPDQSLLPCSFILHYYPWEYGHISIMSGFLKALYHSSLSALAVKQNSIIICWPPTWVRWCNCTGKKPVQGTSEIYWSRHWAVQYCYTAQEEETNSTREARLICLMPHMTLKKILVTCSGREERNVNFSLQMHFILWCEPSNTPSLKDSRAHLWWMWMYFCSLLLVLAQCRSHQTALTQLLSRAEGAFCLQQMYIDALYLLSCTLKTHPGACSVLAEELLPNVLFFKLCSICQVSFFQWLGRCLVACCEVFQH